MGDDKERLLLTLTADEKRNVKVAAANAHLTISAWVADRAAQEAVSNDR